MAEQEEANGPAPVDNGQAQVIDRYFLDKEWYQMMRFRYITSNEYKDEQGKVPIQEWIKQRIERKWYGNSATGTGPVCSCEEADGKCNNISCSLRLDKIECPSSCGTLCQNQTFARGRFNQHVRIEPVGGIFGLVATKRIEIHAPIAEFVGLVQHGQVRYREWFCYPIQRFQNEGHAFINQNKQGNEMRYLHQSDDPNCVLEEWVVGKDLRVLVVSKKVILPGQTLKVSFPQFEESGEEEFLPRSETVRDEIAEAGKIYAAACKKTREILKKFFKGSKRYQERDLRLGENPGDDKPSILWERRDIPPPKATREKPAVVITPRASTRESTKQASLQAAMKSPFRPPKETKKTTPKKAKGRFCCRVRPCPFTYETEQEILDHFNQVHAACVPEVMEPPTVPDNRILETLSTLPLYEDSEESEKSDHDQEPQ